MSDHRTLSEQLADQQQDRHIDKHIAGMVEIETKLLNERIATLEAQLKPDKPTAPQQFIVAHVKELEDRVKELEKQLNAAHLTGKRISEELEGELAEALKLLRRFNYTGANDLKEVPYKYVQELREFLEKHK